MVEFLQVRRILGLCLSLTILLYAGCHRSGATIARVSGTVTHQGKPLEGIMVHFLPDNGRPSYGMTDAQGKYTLEYAPNQPGAVIGSHRVYVSFVPPSVEVEMAIYEGRHQYPPEIRAVLEKYGNPQTTPLRVEVTKGNQTIDLKLD